MGQTLKGVMTVLMLNRIHCPECNYEYVDPGLPARDVIPSNVALQLSQACPECSAKSQLLLLNNNQRKSFYFAGKY